MKLTEQFFTAEDVRGITAEVYRNPTTDEIEQHIPDGARGFIDLKGNLYLEGYDEKRSYSSINHQGVLSMVYHTTPDIFPYSYIEEYNLPLPQVYAATIQRFGTSNEIYVGESEHNSEAITGEFFRRCSQKNPQWKFINKSIATVDPGWSYTRKGGLIGLKDFGENYLVFDPVMARHHYKENSALRDQLRVMGVFNYINEDAAKVTKLTFEDTTDEGKTAKLNTIHSQYPFYIRPTEDYTLNNKVVKVNPEDEVHFQNGHIIVKRDGEVFQDLPAEKIEGIYWVDKSGLNENKINTYKTLMALCERHEYGDYKNVLEIAEPMRAALISYNEGLYYRLVKRTVLPKKLINEEIHYTDVGVITAFLKDNIPPMTDTGGIGKEVKGHLVYAITIATGTILRLFGYNALALAYKSKGKDFIYVLTKQKTPSPAPEPAIDLIDLIGTKASEFGMESYAVFNVDSVAIGELDALKDQLSPGPASEGRKWVKDLKPGDVIEDEIGDELTVQSIDYNENGYFQGSKHYKITFEENPTEPRYYEDDAQVSIASSSKDATSPFEGDPMFQEAITEDPHSEYTLDGNMDVEIDSSSEEEMKNPFEGDEMFKESTDPEIDQYLDIYLKEIGEKIDGMFSEAEEGEQMSLAASTPGKGNLQEKDPERAKHLFKPEIELAPDRKKLVGNIIGTLRKFDRTHHFYDCSSQVPKSLRPYFLELIYQVIQSLSVGEVLKVIEVTRGRESLFTIIYDRVQEKNHKVVTNEDSVTFQSAEQLALFNANEGGTVTVGQEGISLVDYYKTTERKPVKGFENPAKYKSMLHNRLKTNVGEALGLSYFIRDFKIPGSIYKKAIMTMPHDKSSFPDFMVDFSKLDTQSQQTFVEILGFHPPRYIFFDTKATMMASARPGMGNERLQYPRVGKIHDFLRREDILEDGEAIFDNLPVEQHPPTELNYEEFTKLVKFFISSNYESTSDEGYLTGKDLCIVYQEVGKNVGTRAKYYLVDIMDGQSFQINKVSNSTYNVTKNGDQKIAILSFYTPQELKNKLPPEVLAKLSRAKEPEIGSDVAVEEPKEIMADAEESSITKEIMTRIPIEEWSYMLKWQTGGLKPIQLSPYVPTYSKQKEAIGDLEPEMVNPFEGDEMFQEASWEGIPTYNLSSIVKSWDNKVEYSIQEVEIPGFNWACIYYLPSATEIELNKQGEPYYYVWWANYPDDDLGISTMEQAIKMQWGINVSKEEIKIHSLETIPAYVEEPEEEESETTDANPFEGDPMFKEATASKYVAAEADDKHPLMYDTLPLASYIKKMCKLAIPHMFAADIFFWETAPGNGLWYLEMQKTQDSKPFWWYDKKWIGVKTVQRVLRDTYGLEVPTDMINWGVWKYPNPPAEASEEEVSSAQEAPMENPFEGDEMFQEAGGEWTEKKISYDRDVFEAFINKDMDVTQIYGPNFGLYHSIGMSDSHDGYHLRFLYGGHTFAFIPENKTLLYIKAGETNSGSIASAEIAAAVEIKKLAMKKGYSILNELPPNKHDEPELDIGDPFAGDEMFKEASAGHISYWTDDEPLEFILKQTSDAEHQKYVIKEIMDYGIKGYESVRQYTIQYPNVPNLIFILQAKKDVSGGLYERWRKGDDSEFTSTEMIGVLNTKWQDSLLHPEFEEPEEMENPFEGDEMFKENESLQSTYTSKDVALINSFYFGDEEYKSGDHSDNLSIAQGETFWAIVDTNTKKYLLVFKGNTSMTYINTDIPLFMVKTIEIICNKYYWDSKENMIQYADSTQLHQLMTKWMHSYKISGEASEPDEPMPKPGGEKFDPFEGDEMFKEAKAGYKGYHQATDEELLIHFINQDFDWYESEQYELDVINYGSRITHNKYYPESMYMVAMFVENDGLWYVSEFAPVALQESLEKLYNYDHVHFLDSKGQIEKDEVLIKANQKNYVGKPPRPEEEMGNPFEGDPMFKEHFGS